MANKKLLSITSGVALFGAVLGGGIITASAQDSGSTPESTTESSATREERQADYITKLAANLGIDAATLETALKNTALQIVDEQVAAGTLTEERAAEIRAAIDAGNYPVGPGFGGPRHHHGGPGFHMGGSELATFLGIDEATLRESLMSGSTLAEVAEANGSSRDALKTFLTDQFSTNLAEAVAAGDLTQAQADEKLANFTDTLDDRIDGEFRGGPGPRGHRGNFGTPPIDGSSDDDTTALDAAA